MTSPDPTVKVPAIGPVRRRWLFVGAAVIATVVGFAYWRRSQQPVQAVYDPALGTPDAGTGGYQNPAPVSPRSGPVEDEGSAGVISNDMEWGQFAIGQLTQSNWDPQFAAITIGKYLAGQPLTPEEQQVVQAAWALAGHPPSGIQIVAIPQAQPTTPTPTTPTPTTPTPTLPTRRYVMTKKFTSTNPPWDSYLQGIASRFGRTVSQLASWNGISDPNRIGVNQKIYIDPPGSYSGETRAN